MTKHLAQLTQTYRGKTILVTGGCGSIGSALVERLLTLEPARVRVFDNNENRLFELQQQLSRYANVRFFIGDIRDRLRLEMATEGVDILIHAAAYKHVPLCEYNPHDAVLTNVMGTQNVIQTALRSGVEKTLLISTDKAVNPVNTLGATKLLSEKLMLNAAIGGSKSLFSCVRFGNVFNSSGSVVRIFKEQILKGEEVTVTSEEMTRFIMSNDQVMWLILTACAAMQGREIFLLKMRSLRIVDLAEVMIETLAPLVGKDPRRIRIREIGVRPGEKMHEELISESDARYVQETGDLYVLKSGLFLPTLVERPAETHVLKGPLTSRDALRLTKQEIRDLLTEEGILDSMSAAATPTNSLAVES